MDAVDDQRAFVGEDAVGGRRLGEEVVVLTHTLAIVPGSGVPAKNVSPRVHADTRGDRCATHPSEAWLGGNRPRAHPPVSEPLQRNYECVSPRGEHTWQHRGRQSVRLEG